MTFNSVCLSLVVTCNGASVICCDFCYLKLYVCVTWCDFSCFRTLRMIQLYGNGDRNSARRYRAPQEKQRSALLHVTTERGNREEEANLNLLKTHIYTQVLLSQVSWWNTQFPGRICPRRCCQTWEYAAILPQRVRWNCSLWFFFFTIESVSSILLFVGFICFLL